MAKQADFLVTCTDSAYDEDCVELDAEGGWSYLESSPMNGEAVHIRLNRPLRRAVEHEQWSIVEAAAERLKASGQVPYTSLERIMAVVRPPRRALISDERHYLGPEVVERTNIGERYSTEYVDIDFELDGHDATATFLKVGRRLETIGTEAAHWLSDPQHWTDPAEVADLVRGAYDAAVKLRAPWKY